MGNATVQGIRYPYSEDPLTDVDLANLAADLDAALQQRYVTREALRRRSYGEVQRFAGNQVVNRATHTTMLYDTVTEDVDGLWNTGTGRMTPPSNLLGIWMIGFSVTGMGLPSDATFMEFTIRKNATATRYREKVQRWNGSVAVFGEVELLTPGDFVDIDSFWSGGVAASTNYGFTRVYAFQVSNA